MGEARLPELLVQSEHSHHGRGRTSPHPCAELVRHRAVKRRTPRVGSRGVFGAQDRGRIQDSMGSWNETTARLTLGARLADVSFF